MTFRKMRAAKHGATCVLYAVLVGLIALFATMILLLVWPYDDVQFKGDAQIMGPKTVQSGSTLMLKWESFCVNGQDLVYERWADVYDDDGVGEHPASDEVLFSYGIPPFIAYHDVQVCNVPAYGPLTLPNYLPPGTYRIRFSVSYHPNFMRTMYVTTQTEEFTILPKADGSSAPSPVKK